MAYRVELKYPIASPFSILGGETVIEEHLRIDIPASDAANAQERTHLILLAEAAVRHVMDMTGRSPVDGEAVVYTSTVPQRIELPFKASSLQSANYIKDGLASYTAVDLSNFGFFGDRSPSVLFTRNAYTDPGDIELDHPFPWRFKFDLKADDELKTLAVDAVVDDPNTGEDETADAIPEVRQTAKVFQLCGLLFLAHLYENRQAVGYSTAKAFEVPLAFKHLVASIARIK